jgi:purine catabolism regulator
MEGMAISVSVQDILSLNSFAEVYVKAGAEGLSNAVDNVFFMEVPDIYKYVDPYGLLLTTLYPIADDEEAIASFIPNLVEKKVSCVALKLGRYIHDVPPIMLEQADRYRMPLMILPNNANLSKLSNDILELFLGNKTSKLEYRDTIHSKLMGLLLEGADLHKLVATVSDLFGMPVLFVDRYFHIQSASFTEAGDSSLMKANPEQEWADALANRELTVQVGDKVYTGEQVLHRPIVAGSENLGYLIALLPEGSDSADRIIGLEQASMLCAFLFQRELALRQNERNYLDSFIRDLLNHKFPHEQEAVEKARFFDWDLSFPLILLSVEILEEPPVRGRNRYADMLFEGTAEQLLAQELGLPARSYKIVLHDEGLLCLISKPYEEGTPERLRGFCTSLATYYKRQFTLGFGISRPVYDLDKLSAAKEEAKFALEINRKLQGAVSFVAFYEQTGIYKMLHRLSEPEVLRQYAEEKLGRLLSAGNKEADMLNTLLALLQNGFNLQKTAKALYIHYNTLRYRLDKLREYGIDPSDGLALAELALAYQMHTYLLVTGQTDPL